jgi:invasion protein IalB
MPPFRSFLWTLCFAAAGGLVAVAAAEAQGAGDRRRPAARAPSGQPPGGQAALLATFDDWKAFATSAGRGKICYALSEPKARLPKNLNRDPAYLFVSIRPTENVRNEVALVLGFATKDGAAAEAVVGSSRYALVTKEKNAWLRNPAEEGQVISVMARGQKLVVRAQSQRGNQLTDEYSLKGFDDALKRVRDECR